MPPSKSPHGFRMAAEGSDSPKCPHSKPDAEEKSRKEEKGALSCQASPKFTAGHSRPFSLLLLAPSNYRELGKCAIKFRKGPVLCTRGERWLWVDSGQLLYHKELGSQARAPQFDEELWKHPSLQWQGQREGRLSAR